MAAPATIAEIAAAIRVDSTDPRLQGLSDAVDLYITGRLGADAARVPAAVKKEAFIRVVGYLYDAPESAAGRGWANAWLNSGAAALVQPWHESHAGIIAGPDETTTGQPTGGGLDVAAVDARIRELVAGAALVANAAIRWTASKLVMPPSNAEASAGNAVALRLWSAALIRRVVEGIVPAWARAANAPSSPDLSPYAKKSELKVADEILWSVNQSDMLPGETDGEWQFLSAANANVVPLAANASTIAKLRIGRLQWGDGNLFGSEATRDYNTLLASIVPGSVIKLQPYDPSTRKPGAGNFFFVPLGFPVLTDNTDDDEDYYTISGAASVVGAPQNNGNKFWKITWNESEVEVLGVDIIDPAGMIDGDTAEAPDGALARQDGQVRHWPLADMRAHVLGPDTRSLKIGNFDKVTNIPAVAGRISVADAVGELRQVNITWATAQQLAHLRDFLTLGERLTLGTWVFRVATAVTENTVANGGFQFQAATITNAPPANANAIALSVRGRVMHWDADGAAGDVLYHDGTEWLHLPKGADGQVLTLAAGIPSWATPSGGGLTMTKVGSPFKRPGDDRFNPTGITYAGLGGAGSWIGIEAIQAQADGTLPGDSDFNESGPFRWAYLRAGKVVSIPLRDGFVSIYPTGSLIQMHDATLGTYSSFGRVLWVQFWKAS